MKKIVCFIFIFFLTTCQFHVDAQTKTDSSGIWFSDFYQIPAYRSFKISDSILLNYYFFDKAKQQEVFLPVSGNPGSASYNYFRKTSSEKFLNDGFSQFEPYLLSPLKLFPGNYSQRRFTNINYHIGTKKEQHIFIKHEQKIRPGMFAGLDFGALSSPGDFSRTLNTNRNFDIYFGYEAHSKVYRNYLSFTSNVVENQENGGISSDSVFENASSLNTRTLPVNLPLASIKHRQRDYFIKQELNLFNLFHPADSIEKTKSFGQGSLVLSHSLWWKRKSILFISQNADSGYFTNFIDTVITHDSSFFNDLYQVAMIEYNSKETLNKSSFRVGGGFEYQQFEYETGSTDTTFKSGAIIVSAGFTSRRMKSSVFISKSTYGVFDKTFRSGVNLSIDFGKPGSVFFINLNAAKLAHGVREIFYRSQYFNWNNNFKLLEQYDAEGGINFSQIKLNIIVRSRSSKNIVYYSDDYQPRSFGEFVNVSDISASKAFTFGKFGLDSKVTISASGNESIVPVSPFAIFSALYYQNLFFKKVLGFRAGFDVNYFSEYYGYGYMPATGIFYVQTEKKIGNTPLIGVFVNMTIKSKARLFIRLDHANAGIGERTYYGALHYPLPGRTFKFGVTWDLVD